MRTVIRVKILTRTLLMAFAMILILAGIGLVPDHSRGHAAYAMSEDGLSSLDVRYSRFSLGRLVSRVERHPAALLRFSAENILAVFDAPELVRSEGDVVHWQYRSAACVVDFYFTQSDQMLGDVKVRHFEVRPTDLNAPYVSYNPLACSASSKA